MEYVLLPAGTELSLHGRGEWHCGCLGRVVDILGASGASDPGSNPGRDVLSFLKLNELLCILLVE